MCRRDAKVGTALLTARHSCATLLTAVFLMGGHPAFASWTLSSDVKALIAKADAGDVEAQFRVGSAYDTGDGAPRSGSKALKYYRMAAEQGYAEAQNSLASGLQADKKYAEALGWYEKAAAQGHALATNNLGYLYYFGLGVAQNRKRGMEYYTRAAELGWAEAMWNLANVYGAGTVGRVDMLSACVWTLRARKYADPADESLQAMTFSALPYLSRTLPAADMDECRQRASAWAPGGPKATPITP